jgi:hypothetical protein
VHRERERADFEPATADEAEQRARLGGPAAAVRSAAGCFDRPVKAVVGGEVERGVEIRKVVAKDERLRSV